MPESAKDQPDSVVSFGPYRLDLGTGQLWRGTHAVKLTGKAFGVLRYFVEHPGQLVTKDDLFEAVWPQTVVTESTLASCIQELRQALRDDAKKPRYIETVHRRGYRFIAPLTTGTPPSLESSVQRLASKPRDARLPGLQTLDPRRQTLDVPLVGREAELTQLHGWLEKALNGERQLVFVTGEAGIGKTALVETFLVGVGGWGLGLGSSSHNPRVSSLKPQVFLYSTQPLSSLIPNPQFPTPGFPGGNASSTMGQESPTCPCWKRWDGCAGNLRGSI